MDLDIRQLTCFAEVARSGSVTRAAQRLHIAQSALSRRIIELERTVGAELFLRRPDGVELTAIGRKVLDHADRLIEGFERLRQDILRDAALSNQRIEFGIPASASFLVTEAMMGRFRALHPQVRLHLVEAVSMHLLDWVLSGTLDLALVTNPTRSSLLRIQPLWRESLYVVEGPDGRFGQDGLPALRNRRFILTSRSDGVRETLQRLFLDAGFELEVDLEMELVSSVKTMVAAGNAFTILPFSRVAAEVEAGTLNAAPLQGAEITRALVHRSGKVLSPAMRDFGAVLREEVRLTMPEEAVLEGITEGT